MSLRHWLQLSLTAGIGPVLIRRLIEAAGGVETACDATPALLRGVDGIGTSKASSIHQSLKRADEQVEIEMTRAVAAGVRIICPDDADYPAMIRSIPDPPVVLYVRGSLEARDLNAVAIVGSRRCSYYGREQAERFAALLAGAGFTIISGGARGIDSAAHRGALQHPQGRTLAVLGSGVDVPYPPENAAFFNQIATRGAVISEFPLGAEPLKTNFPRRNRIVSGLSRGVLVIEADEKSGALITARQACDDHGRPVFALPGKVDNPLSAGPHQLIRDGAVLTATLEDILNNLGPPPQYTSEPGLFASLIAAKPTDAEAPMPDATPAAPTVSPMLDHLTDRQRTLLAALDSSPVGIDDLVDRTNLPPGTVLQELTFLSLKGFVKRADGQTFAKIGR